MLLLFVTYPHLTVRHQVQFLVDLKLETVAEIIHRTQKDIALQKDEDAVINCLKSVASKASWDTQETEVYKQLSKNSTMTHVTLRLSNK